MAYLRETQKTALGHITRLIPYRRGETLALDEMTRRSLELTRTLREGKREGSLLQVIDRTVTPMGARLLAEWLTSPLTAARRRSPSGTTPSPSCSATRSSAATCGQTLGEAHDLERLAARVGTGRATPRDLVALARTLALLPKIKARLDRPGRRSGSASSKRRWSSAPRSAREIEAALVDDPPLALKEGGLIRDGYHPELDELRAIARGGKSWIARYPGRAGPPDGDPGPEGRVQQGLRLLHRDHARPGPGGRKVPADYIRKQTVKNAERYITPELKEYEDKVREAEDRAYELEYELFITLRDRVAAEAPRLIQAGAVLAQVDVLAALAELAARQGYCRPEIVAEPVLEIEAGPAPGARRLDAPGDFVPNDTRLGPGPTGHDPAHHRAEHGGQEHLHPPGRPDRGAGPDRQLRARHGGRGSASSTACSPASAPPTS